MIECNVGPKLSIWGGGSDDDDDNDDDDDDLRLLML